MPWPYLRKIRHNVFEHSDNENWCLAMAKHQFPLLSHVQATRNCCVLELQVSRYATNTSELKPCEKKTKSMTLPRVPLQQLTLLLFDPSLAPLLLFRLCVCLCVCVKHRNRCQTCTVFLSCFWLRCRFMWRFSFKNWQWVSFHPLPNEDGGLKLWYRDWSSRHACKAFHVLDMGCGQPKNHLAEFFNFVISFHVCTVVGIWISFLAQLKTWWDFPDDGGGHYDFLLTIFWNWKAFQSQISSTDQDVMECFLHVQCVPQFDKTSLSKCMYACVKHINRCKTCTLIFLSCRGRWHATRDHIQRSYLIACDREPDQLCVPAPLSNLYGERPSQ